MKVEIGEDEQLVPEDVTTVGLPVQAAGRDTHVQVQGVPGGGLEQVKDVQSQSEQRQATAVFQLQRESVPQVIPVPDVAVQEVVEASDAPDPGARIDPGFADRPVLRGEEGDYLFDGDRLGWRDVHGQFVSYEPWLLHHPSERNH